MSEIKKIDFRDLGPQSPSQPENYEEAKSKNGFSFGASFTFWERMTKKAKIEVVTLVLVLLVTAGCLILYFLD